MIAKVDLEALAEMRLLDTVQLFQSSRFSAAYSLSGYAVELGIKACIAKVFRRTQFLTKPSSRRSTRTTSTSYSVLPAERQITSRIR